MLEKSTDNRNDFVDGYRNILDGKGAGHIWLSHDKRYQGALMQIVFTKAGIRLNDGDHGLPDNFANDVQLYCIGPIPVEYAQKKLDSLLSVIEGQE